ELEFSRQVLLLSGVLVVALGVYPYLASRFLLHGSALLLALVLYAGFGLQLNPPAAEATPLRLHSANYTMEVETFQPLAGLPDVSGGAIERFGDGFIVATGDGQFHALRWSADGSELLADRLPLPSPLVNRDDFYADKPGSGLQYRVTDLLLQEVDTGWEMIVAHQLWDRAGNCFRMAVSSALLPEPGAGSAAAANSWTRLYETKPCIRPP